MQNVPSLKEMATITDVKRFFKQLQGAAEYASDENPGWLNHKSILPGIRIRFGNSLPWTDKFDDITDEPPYLALQAIADKQQALYVADLNIPGNYRDGPEDVPPGDFLPLYMMMKSRLLGTRCTRRAMVEACLQCYHRSPKCRQDTCLHQPSTRKSSRHGCKQKITVLK